MSGDEWAVDATVKTDDALLVRRFSLRVLEGPDAGEVWRSNADACSIGTNAANDLVLSDLTVSRFHAEVRIEERGARLRDLGSSNGTRLDGTKVLDALPRNGSLIRIGRTTLAFDVGQSRNRLPISEHRRFGTLVGESAALRAVFSTLEKVAPTDVTVLIEGETGTGKEEVATSIHQGSARADQEMVVVDCGAIPANLIESYLFGHEAGAFTGATSARAGAFEEADGGTLLLDEIGELPLEMQPKLLRVLEAREVRRIGSTHERPVDVRVVAATNRDLRREVSEGRFREDLYYRLAVVRVTIPPLRERPEDIPVLVDDLLGRLRLDDEARERLSSAEHLAALRAGAWPGNVRELRNHLERAALFDDVVITAPSGASSLDNLVDPTLPYAEARRRVLELFEASYGRALVERHGGNVSKAAREAGMGRTYLHRILKRHGYRRE